MVVLLAIAWTWFVSLCWFVLMAKRPYGRFEVNVDTRERFAFRSNCGDFSLHHPSGTLTWTHKGKRASTKLVDIRGFDYLANDEEDWIGELIWGFDLTDMWPGYRDTIEWHEIAILTSPQGRVPVFRTGRVQRREFLFTWLMNFQERLLIRVGVLRDVEQQSREALSLLEQRFGRGMADRR